MDEYVVRMANDVAVKRCFPRECVFATLEALSTLIAHCKTHFGPVTQVIVRDRPAGVLDRHPVRFTNICGKIDHVSHHRIYQPGVQPLVRPIKNAFGKFHGVYSKHCNLLTCTSKTSTLFRGGRNSRQIFRVIQHAIQPQNLCKMTVHMFVATARLGYGIVVASRYLNHYVAQDPRWTCTTMPYHEEMSYVNSMKLTDFDPVWIKSLGLSAPQSVVVNVSKNGSVNFFMTMGAGVRFTQGVEVKFRPLFVQILEVVYAGS